MVVLDKCFKYEDENKKKKQQISRKGKRSSFNAGIEFQVLKRDIGIKIETRCNKNGLCAQVRIVDGLITHRGKNGSM